jgi:hypothetical protein
VGKPQTRKETTWKTRRKWEGNIKKDLRKTGRGGIDYTDLPRNRN